MNITTTKPTEGQFVTVWEFQGKIWSDTFKYINGKLKRYETEVDDFVNDNLCPEYNADKVHYIVSL